MNDIVLKGKKRGMASRRRFATLGAAAAMLPMLPRSGRAAPAPVSLRLDYTPWGEQAAYYLANAKGWYRDYGIDVILQSGSGSGSTVQIVGNDHAIDAGAAALSSMMIATSRGTPVQSIACFARQNAIGLIVPAGSAVHKVADLRGKKIGYTAGANEGAFVTPFLAAGGLTAADCNLINLDGSAKLGEYITGHLDAIFSPVPFILPIVSQKRASRAISFSSVGINFPGYGLFATKQKILERQTELTALAGVTAAAWGYIAASPDHAQEAVDAILHFQPHAQFPAPVLLGQIQSYITFFSTPATQGKPIGWQAEVDWQAGVQTLVANKLIPAALPAQNYFTNALLPGNSYSKVV